MTSLDTQHSTELGVKSPTEKLYAYAESHTMRFSIGVGPAVENCEQVVLMS